MSYELSRKAFDEMVECGAVDAAMNRMLIRKPESTCKTFVRIMLNIRKSLITQFYDVPRIETAFLMTGSPRRKLIVFFTNNDLDAVQVRTAANREKLDNRFFLVREKPDRKERERHLICRLEEEERGEIMSELKDYHDRIRYSKDLRWLLGELNPGGFVLSTTREILNKRIREVVELWENALLQCYDCKHEGDKIMITVENALGSIGIKEKVRNLPERRKK